MSYTAHSNVMTIMRHGSQPLEQENERKEKNNKASHKRINHCKLCKVPAFYYFHHQGAGVDFKANWSGATLIFCKPTLEGNIEHWLWPNPKLLPTQYHFKSSYTCSCRMSLYWGRGGINFKIQTLGSPLCSTRTRTWPSPWHQMDTLLAWLLCYSQVTLCNDSCCSQKTKASQKCHSFAVLARRNYCIAITVVYFTD